MSWSRLGRGPGAGRAGRHLRLRHAHPARLEPVRGLPADHRARVRRGDRGFRSRACAISWSATMSSSIRSSRAGAAIRAASGAPMSVPIWRYSGCTGMAASVTGSPVPAANVVKVAKALPLAIAALAEPFSIAANVLSRTGCGPEDTVLIYGAGTVGLTVLQVAKLKGARCIVADIDAARLSGPRTSAPTGYCSRARKAYPRRWPARMRASARRWSSMAPACQPCCGRPRP